MAAAPRYALFVSSVEGRLVSRPGSPHAYLGARVPGQEGGEIEWTPDVVVAIAEPEYLRFSREWDQLIRGGDLEKRNEADFEAYSKALAASEAERDKRLELEAAAAQKAQTEQAPSAGAQE